MPVVAVSDLTFHGGYFDQTGHLSSVFGAQSCRGGLRGHHRRSRSAGRQLRGVGGAALAARTARIAADRAHRVRQFPSIAGPM